MIAKQVQEKIDAHVDTYFDKIVSGEWTLAHAHQVLSASNGAALNLDLFQIAALAKAIAICQCADDAGIEY